MSVEKDPWLQQALRHAPDHDVAVPEAVRDTILTAARAAVRQPQPTPRRRWWQGGWPQMAPTRLGYSGALMALLVVGLWGVDRLEQPATVPERGEVLAVPAAAPAPASPAAPAVAASSAPAATPPAAPEAAAARQLRGEAVATRQRAMDTPAVTAKAAEPERRRAAAPDEATPAAPAVAAVSAEPGTAPIAAASALKAPQLTAVAEVASKRAETTQANLAEASPRLRAASAPAAPPRAAKAAPVPPGQPEPALADPLAQARQAWRWQPDLAWQTATGQQGPQGPVQEAWLTRLQQALSGPWQLAPPPAGPPSVQWPGPGGTQLWLTAEGQVWLARAGQVHQAPLPAADAAALLGQLPDWR